MNLSIFYINEIEVTEFISSDDYPVLFFRSQNKEFVTSIKCARELFYNEYFWSKICDRINTIIHNRIKFEEKLYENENDILEFVQRVFPKHTPQEKLNIVLEFLHSLTKYDGQTINISLNTIVRDPEIWRKYYFNNFEEFEFYITNLFDQGLVFYGKNRYDLNSFHITLKGLTTLINIEKDTTNKICFVAMSFDPSLKSVYSRAIQPAIVETGFIPFIVNDQHVESDKTINDAIIAGIKRSHFTIADFTMHRAGVYFEAGYALGRGQKVIYTCRKNDIGNAHFDTRNFQHIVWETEEELRIKLIDKINATIVS